jgi:hypothetical protein
MWAREDDWKRLTPELSRADRGDCEPVLLARRQVSTKLRYGVGLNELLGAWEPDNNNTPTLLPKSETTDIARAPNPNRAA